MSVSNFDELVAHRGHEIEVVTYNGGQQVLKGPRQNHQSYWHHLNYIVNVAIECHTCHEVLLDFDREVT